ncbi:MAG TPA: phosphate ABC transporter ATP-binding protein [Cytophagaceae bacterium]
MTTDSTTQYTNTVAVENGETRTVISVKNLNVFHDKHQILKNVNLEIPEKKITVFLGPSGCGKTTLLKSLNRLTDLQNKMRVEGSIQLRGQEILSKKNDIVALRQKMGLLSQRPFPLPMSIFDNVAFGLRIQGLKNKTEIAHKVEYHLKQVALWDEVKDRLHTSAARMSIGQQQRLCLARGLAVNPDVILADEPTSALDPISSRKIEEQFSELKKDYTIILVTHMLRQAKRLADNAVFMYYGEVVEQGAPSEMFNNPKTEILKNYLSLG